jgi:hypothetical protein
MRQFEDLKICIGFNRFSFFVVRWVLFVFRWVLVDCWWFFVGFWSFFVGCWVVVFPKNVAIRVI